MSKITKAFEAASNKIVAEHIKNSGLIVDDIYSVAEPYLTEKTKLALSKKAKSISLYETTDRDKSHTCVYLGKRVLLTQVEEGVKYVAEKVNALGEAGKIHSCLANFVKFDLTQSGAQPKETLVLCFVMVDVQTHAELMANTKSSGAFSQGSMPE